MQLLNFTCVTEGRYAGYFSFKEAHFKAFRDTCINTEFYKYG